MESKLSFMSRFVSVMVRGTLLSPNRKSTDCVVFLILVFLWLLLIDFSLGRLTLNICRVELRVVILFVSRCVWGEGYTYVCDEVRGKPQASFLRR